LAKEFKTSLGRAGDDPGHVIAKVLGGHGDIPNIVPINSTLNRGQLASLEKRIAQHVGRGGTADIHVKFNYAPGSTSFRPTAIEYKWKLSGQSRWSTTGQLPN
jgi:hypothetical protein